MTRLPPPLRPWETPLALFGDVVHEGFADWLLPLRTAIGPMTIPHTAREGDPDGFDGLDRRGSYERLLLSEWAIALELPDEFLRRAAMSEHVFLAPAYVDPRGARTSVALLDCGPLQLGAPRLVHLAALVVLAQRAADAGSEFRFGSLQGDSCYLFPFDRASVMAWTGARRWSPAHPLRASWDARLDDDAPHDIWFVGSIELLAWAASRRAGLLEIDEVVGAGARRVLVRAHPPGAAPRQVELELPPRQTCVRILRAPLAPRVVAPITRREPQTMADALGQLAGDGRRILLRRRDGGVAALHVPNTPADRRGRTKHVEPTLGSRIVGADMFRARLVALCVGDDGELVVRGAGYEDDASRSLSVVMRTERTAPPAFLRGRPSFTADTSGVAQRAANAQILDTTTYVTHADVGRFEAWILASNRELWHLRCVRSGVELVLVEDACLDIRRIAPGVVAWVSGTRRRVVTSIGEPPDQDPLDDAALASVVFGAMSILDRSNAVFGWVDGSAGEFVIRAPAPARRPLPDGRVIGLAGRSGFPFVLLDADARSIRVSDLPAPSFVSVEPLLDVRYEPSALCVVWRTRSGEFGVSNLWRDSLVLRVEAREGWNGG